MKIIVLTGAFGMGHHSAAKAIKEEILATNPDANIDIIDMIEYIFPSFSKVIYGAFNFMVSKFSFVYNFFNKIAAQRASVPLKASVVRRIDSLLKNKEADMVISTFPACTQYISAYKKMKNCNIPLYTYITDITANEEWIGEKTDMYFVGSEETKSTLIIKGVDKEKIIVSGIPVKRCFKNHMDNKDNKDNKCKKEILIMGGGLGLIPDSEALLGTLCKIEDIQVTFIAGKNEKLLNKIKLEYPQIEAVGFTDKVYDYMQKSDLIISKSGGITLFEAIHCNTPLYVIRPFLCQEVGNAKFIQEHCIGKIVWSRGTNISEDVTSLLKNDILLNEMKNNMKITKDKLENTSPYDYYGKGVGLCG